VPNIQRVVNAAFAPVMDGDIEARQAQYVPLEASRADHQEQPSVVALPCPSRTAQRFISPRSIEKSLPDAIGAYVHWLVTKSGWTVTERRIRETGAPRGASHLHLFRRFVSFGEDITRPTSKRSTRAASSTCSSAARRFTIARRSKRCARR
jgi:hypothetical protein